MSAPEPIIDHGHGDSRLLVRSPYTTTFEHMGEVYVYHDLYGYHSYYYKYAANEPAKTGRKEVVGT